MKAFIGESRVARRLAFFGLVLAACLGLLGSSQQASAGIPGGPTDPLSKVEKRILNDTANGKTTQFVVLMTEQADVSAGNAMKDQDARGWFVYNTLKTTADKSQTDIKAMLTKRGAAYKSYWAVNMLIVTGDRSLVETIAARADVKELESNAPFKGIDDPINITNSPVTYDNPKTVEWGVQRVNAPQVWAMGFTGQGIVVGNQDTGMRWTHNAIKPHYRGWDGSTANHNYNWWDSIHTGGGACGPNNQAPCDDNAHGTHTTGTTTGDDGAGNQIGVAPGAKWMGCRNMDQGNGTPATYTECFQFFIAPTDLSGNNPNPALRPHVMNNSWGCPTSEGCAVDTLRAIVENTQAAGIFVETSAGNAGPGCSTLTDPPAFYEASFATGALDINNALAGFSSRGPVTQDGSGRLKPNVSAPGVNNRSSVNTSDTSYSNFSGTSMAGPHVVGVVALLWSAHPELSRNIAATKNILQMSANPQVTVSASPPYCGNTPPTQIPNNYFGYGRVDALAAVNNAGPTATPCGSCTNTATATPIGGTATRTPTPCGAGGGWTAGPTMPSALVRGVGVWYPNGLNRFYVMGGRSSDTAGSDLQNPRYFDTSSSTWTVDTAASFPDNQVNNMACADLNGSGGHRIYCVGGSAAGATTSSSAVRAYDPAAHTITALSSDNWPVSNTLPGGFAVVNNKLYILGGYILNVSMSRQIWVFDPNGTAGARWTLKNGQVPDPGAGSLGLGYIPAAAVGNVIYTGGGSHWDPTTSTIADDPKTFSYDTVSDTVSDTAVPDMPAPGDAETRAINMGGKVWVIGGGRTAPNPTSNVMQFDPSNPSAGWTMVNSFTGARRNFPVDVDPATGKIYLAGGYMPSTPTDTMQIYQPPQTCGTSTPTPNRTNTPTNTTVRTSTITVTFVRTGTMTMTPIRTMTGTPMRTNTPIRTGTPRSSVTPCGDCAIEMLAVVTSCYLDGTVHWIAIAHNPDRCMVQAPWRAELQVRNNGGNFRTVRIQYATSNFMPGDTVWDGYFCYHFSSNVRDMRVEVLYEDQAGRSVSPGSKATVQERGAPANSYSTTPDSGRPVAKNGTGDSPTQCNGDMASHPMAPCQSNDGCSPPPSPIPTGVSTRAPVLPTK